MSKLYGDGIHDDLPAIQKMLDSKTSCVYLPPPEKNYLISGTIRIHSNQELRMDRHTLIKLAPMSNCVMATNAEPDEWNVNISINGGVWDMNHSCQHPNPLHYPNPDMNGMKLSDALKANGFDPTQRKSIDIYTGMCFMFNSIKSMYFGNLTIVNPVTFGADFSYVEDFTIENIRFEYNEGSPKLWNMDGIHIEGCCKNGIIRNLKGACHDDLVALTADDFYHGPIENIVIDGIWAEKSHSAVRLLSYKSKLRNVHITNVFGTYYVYAIIIGKFFESDDKSYFENITIDHIHASFCEGTKDVEGNYGPLISIEHDMEIKSLYLSHIFRDETHCSTPTIGIGEGTHIGLLKVDCAQQTNTTGKKITFLKSNGIIDRLELNNIDVGEDELTDIL